MVDNSPKLASPSNGSSPSGTNINSGRIKISMEKKGSHTPSPSSHYPKGAEVASKFYVTDICSRDESPFVRSNVIPARASF